jgi:hypothetical protein
MSLHCHAFPLAAAAVLTAALAAVSLAVGPVAAPPSYLAAGPLTGAALPVSIHVRAASGEVQRCAHSLGVGTDPSGGVWTGDGWACSPLAAPLGVALPRPR